MSNPPTTQKIRIIIRFPLSVHILLPSTPSVVATTRLILCTMAMHVSPVCSSMIDDTLSGSALQEKSEGTNESREENVGQGLESQGASGGRLLRRA